MIYSANKISKGLFEKALEKGCKTFLYNEIDFATPNSKDITFFNCSTQRIPSTWFTWKKNEEILLSFKSKYPHFFQWGKYDLTLAFLKSMYWANQKTGFLHYSKTTFFPNESVCKEEEMHPVNGFKTRVKIILHSLRRCKPSKQLSSNGLLRPIGIHIKQEFQIVLYKFILLAVSGNQNFTIFANSNSLHEKLITIGIPSKQIYVCSNSSYCKRIPLINLFNLNKEELYVLNHLTRCWQGISELVGLAEEIASKGIKKLLLNEGENGVYGAVMGEVMRKNNITTYNTMNGMKSGQAQDAYINFNYWFVWDQQMKKMLVEKNKLNPKMLLISGHLMEDEVNNYSFQNSIGIDLNEFDGKKLISVLTVPGIPIEKTETFKYLYKIAENNSDIILLIRAHPSEKEKDYIRPTRQLNNVRWIQYNTSNSKTTLYDQLSISHMSICFGSTIALESKWFGVPCISVEKREPSLIYAIDEEMIFKTDKLEDDLFFKLFNGEKNKVETNHHNVAQYIINILENSEKI